VIDNFDGRELQSIGIRRKGAVRDALDQEALAVQRQELSLDSAAGRSGVLKGL